MCNDYVFCNLKNSVCSLIVFIKLYREDAFFESADRLLHSFVPFLEQRLWAFDLFMANLKSFRFLFYEGCGMNIANFGQRSHIGIVEPAHLRSSCQLILWLRIENIGLQVLQHCIRPESFVVIFFFLVDFQYFSSV